MSVTVAKGIFQLVADSAVRLLLLQEKKSQILTAVVPASNSNGSFPPKTILFYEMLADCLGQGKESSLLAFWDGADKLYSSIPS